jgi:hypothetical protein
VTITALDRATVERYAEELLRPDPGRVEQLIRTPGTEVWEEVRPWRATYWKTFPRAHRLRFAVTSVIDPLPALPLAVEPGAHVVPAWYTPAWA